MTLITIAHSNKTVLAPIIFNFKAQITKHIIIYDIDREDTRYALELKKGIESIWQKYRLPKVDIEMIAIDEDSRKDMVEIQKRLSKEQGSSLYLNASEADVSLLTILSGFVLSFGGTILAYDKQDNSYNKITQKGFENYPITESMNIDDFLRLLGEELIEEKSKQKIWENRKALETLFEDTKILFKVRKLLIHKQISQIKKSYPKIYKTLQELKLPHTVEMVEADSSLGGFGNLFEDFVFLFMSRFDFDDIKCGAKIVFERDKQGDKDTIVANEFDILTIKNNRIGLIECKIGNNIQPLPIVYKSDALMDYFGDDTRSLIIHIQPQTVDNRLVFQDGIKLRANSNLINIFNAFDIGKRKFTESIKETFGVLPKHFLLGGYDLEMLTIKQLLQKTGEKFSDRKLGWGAKLSDYRDILNDDEHFYAIELEIDITPPKHFTLIDHHNALQDNPSSLEQILTLLDYPMNRFYQLVALNDKGYIPALEEFGATAKEIANIRELDRKAQGVSEEDEKLAVESIKSAKSIGRVTIIKALTDKFSPIIDRLYKRNVIIYTDKKLTYYGEGIRELVDRYSNLIETKRAYYGGGFGFFGIAEGSFGKKEIEDLVDEIVEIINKKRGR